MARHRKPPAVQSVSLTDVPLEVPSPEQLAELTAHLEQRQQELQRQVAWVKSVVGPDNAWTHRMRFADRAGEIGLTARSVFKVVNDLCEYDATGRYRLDVARLDD